ncbi:hypothetical protein [Psychrobacter vallis]|uniref:hypothetical protein n=1 Tax=Psychrobacter vallis TaxID=248451 RepID=UPI001918CFD0|nr:hypothetical protein [Psychrobacter vallis]
MSKRHSSQGFYLPDFTVFSRIVLAIGGSYGVAVLTDLVFLSLPMETISAIYWGQIASIVVCAVMIILVFSLRRLWLAWTVVTVIAGILGMICYATI